MRKKLYLNSSDEGIVIDYLKKWGINFKVKCNHISIDANEIDGVAVRLEEKLIIHIIR